MDAVQATIIGYIETGPYLLHQKYDADTGQFTVRVSVEHLPPPVLPLLIGDCLYNLRSALDHLASAIPGAPGRPNQVHFPILNSDTDFKIHGAWRIAHMPVEARDIIGSLQPYSGGNLNQANPLWVLNALCNEDKHRNLVICGYTNVGLGVGITELRDVDMFAGHIGALEGAFEHGAIVASMVFKRTGPKPKVHLDFDATFDVAFAQEGKARGAPVIAILKQIEKHIREEVFPKLEPFL